MTEIQVMITLSLVFDFRESLPLISSSLSSKNPRAEEQRSEAAALFARPFWNLHNAMKLIKVNKRLEKNPCAYHIKPANNCMIRQ